jgi:endonuclease/exonuclease/phosphatase family metal-dependent hydrolase
MRPLAILTIYLLTSTIHAEELRILAWNVESDGNNPDVIVSQLHELSGYDIVGLTEVRASSIKKYVDALSASGNTFLSINTATGGSDRIALAYNTKRLQLLSGYEMHRFGDWLLNSQGDDGRWRHRSPLVGHFRDRESSVDFLVTVNHLARGDENIRRRQAAGLRKWAEAQSLPLIAIGDYNFDYNFHDKAGNKAFQYSLRTICGNGCSQRN